MKLVFLLIAFFVLACLFYGIFAGVSAIGWGVSRIGGSQHQSSEFTIQPKSANTAMPPGPHRNYLAELQNLFVLHQSGALTVGEFEQLKQRFLAEMN